MQSLDNHNTVMDLLAQGAGLLTPNNRLSGVLLEQYVKHCGSSTVPKPYCLPYPQALVKAYEALRRTKAHATHPLLLNSAQTQHLWRTILQADAHITYSEGLLDAVLQAWTTCESWLIRDDHASFCYTPQTLQFQQWWQAFNVALHQRNAITEQHIVSYLIQCGVPLFPQSLIWVCFDAFTPQQHALQQFLQTQGVQQYRYDLQQPNAAPTLFCASNTNEEYEQVIAWLQQRLAAGDEAIGLVLPNLQQEAHTLQRVLLTQFDPSVFNIYLGLTLEAFPLITHALTWLSLDTQQLSKHQANLLLQSPYLAAQEEFLSRAAYLQHSKLLQEPHIPFALFITNLHNDAPKLAQMLLAITAFPEEACVDEWIALFQERLRVLGFPGDMPLAHETALCFNRFLTLFDELRQLHLLSPSLSKTAALEAITALTRHTIFQAEKTTPRIHVLGLLEASGCAFDSLWIMGLTDASLPQKTRLSAFIAPALQKSQAMPHTLPDKEWFFAQQTLERFQKSCKHLVYSYARMQADTPNLPCTLIQAYPPYQPQPSLVEINTPLVIEEECYAMPLQAGEILSAGTALLANQAQCPFKAFAQHRLHANPLLPDSEGLSPQERGQAVHHAMETLWRKIQTQENLFAYNDLALDKAVTQAIHTALSPLKVSRPLQLTDLMYGLELTRLKRLVVACLQWEKTRAPFAVVALEQSYTLELAGFTFKIRIDRLDNVDGHTWVIDYKTSLPQAKPWEQERPNEPQLLLYALVDTTINTLLYLQLKAGKIKAQGLSHANNPMHGMTSLKKDTPWEQCISHWKQQLAALVQEFQAGHCAPTPTHASLCQRCDFQNLCRFQKD